MASKKPGISPRPGVNPRRERAEYSYKTGFEWMALNDDLRNCNLAEAELMLRKEIAGPKRKSHLRRIQNRVNRLSSHKAIADLLDANRKRRKP